MAGKLYYNTASGQEPMAGTPPEAHYRRICMGASSPYGAYPNDRIWRFPSSNKWKWENGRWIEGSFNHAWSCSYRGLMDVPYPLCNTWNGEKSLQPLVYGKKGYAAPRILYTYLVHARPPGCFLDHWTKGNKLWFNTCSKKLWLNPRNKQTLEHNNYCGYWIRKKNKNNRPGWLYCMPRPDKPKVNIQLKGRDALHSCETLPGLETLPQYQCNAMTQFIANLMPNVFQHRRPYGCVFDKWNQFAYNWNWGHKWKASAWHQLVCQAKYAYAQRKFSGSHGERWTYEVAPSLEIQYGKCIAVNQQYAYIYWMRNSEEGCAQTCEEHPNCFQFSFDAESFGYARVDNRPCHRSLHRWHGVTYANPDARTSGCYRAERTWGWCALHYVRYWHKFGTARQIGEVAWSNFHAYEDHASNGPLKEPAKWAKQPAGTQWPLPDRYRWTGLHYMEDGIWWHPYDEVWKRDTSAQYYMWTCAKKTRETIFARGVQALVQKNRKCELRCRVQRKSASANRDCSRYGRTATKIVVEAVRLGVDSMAGGINSRSKRLTVMRQLGHADGMLFPRGMTSWQGPDDPAWKSFLKDKYVRECKAGVTVWDGIDNQKVRGFGRKVQRFQDVPRRGPLFPGWRKQINAITLWNRAFSLVVRSKGSVRAAWRNVFDVVRYYVRMVRDFAHSIAVYVRTSATARASCRLPQHKYKRGDNIMLRSRQDWKQCKMGMSPLQVCTAQCLLSWGVHWEFMRVQGDPEWYRDVAKVAASHPVPLPRVQLPHQG